MFMIDPGMMAQGCVGAGETVYLRCKVGYEVIQDSLLSMMEFPCQPDGRLDLWKVELCVRVECGIPLDWLKFTG